MPDRLGVLEPGLPQRLATAFARHPWVEAVERAEVVPPRQLRVRLHFRTPVLLVRPADGPTVMVDGAGVWLPSVAAETLPEFTAAGLAAPTGPRGTAYGQPDVAAAATLAAFLHETRDKVPVRRLELGSEGFTLTTPVARIFWGHAPGKEVPGEPAASVKRERFLRVGPLPPDVVFDLRRDEARTER
jgi:hypothetical protein